MTPLESLLVQAIQALQSGDISATQTHVSRLLTLQPEHAEALRLQGLVYAYQQQPVEALAWLDRAINQAPDLLTSYLNKAQILENNGQINAAKQLLESLLEQQPQYVPALKQLALIEAKLYHHAQASQYLKHALTLQKNDIDLLLALGRLEHEQGHSDISRRCFDQAFSLAPASVTALYHAAYYGSQKHLPQVIRSINKQLNGSVSQTDKVYLLFALAHSHELRGNFELAGPAFIQANRLKRTQFEFDVNCPIQQCKDLKASFNAVFMAQLGNDNSPCDESFQPIFIVGMPRSGSTLIEQMLLTCDSTCSIGESNRLLELVDNYCLVKSSDHINYPQQLTQLNASDLKQLADQYKQQVQAHPLYRAGTRPIDKMPKNFLNIPLIKLMFPKASIIHSHRNPLDCSLSCYSRLFNHGHQHQCYDLRELGVYYRAYLDLMRFWKENLAEHTFTSIEYEHLIDSPISASQELFEACDLEWHENVLNFHTNNSIVKTSSMSQVRQPLYKSSVGKWKHYRELLKPLLNAIGNENLVGVDYSEL